MSDALYITDSTLFHTKEFAHDVKYAMSNTQNTDVLSFLYSS